MSIIPIVIGSVIGLVTLFKTFDSFAIAAITSKDKKGKILFGTLVLLISF